MASWEAAALPQGHRCVINVQIHILELDLCLTKAYNVYGVCAITICLFVTHFIIFTLPPTGQLPSVNCCNILIQIVLFVIYIWVPL